MLGLSIVTRIAVLKWHSDEVRCSGNLKVVKSTTEIFRNIQIFLRLALFFLAIFLKQYSVLCQKQSISEKKVFHITKRAIKEQHLL